MNALVTSSQRFPFCLSNSQLDILRDMHHRLDTPDRLAFWYAQGKVAGLAGESPASPMSLIRERRLYRLGWVFGRLRHEPRVAPLPCCAATVAHKLNKGNAKCVRCGSEL